MKHPFNRAPLAMLMLTLALGVGCARLPITPVTPPPGFLYEEVQAPLSSNYHATPVDAPKTGTATTRYFALFYPILSLSWEDCSIESAAKNGGITEVDYADYRFFNVLGIYEEFTVIVHGR